MKKEIESKLFLTYSKAKLGFLTLLLLFLVVFPRYLPVRIDVPEKRLLGGTIIAVWLVSVILLLFFYVLRKLKIQSKALMYIDIAVDLTLLSLLLAIYSEIGGPWFFVFAFIILGAAFYLNLTLVLFAGSLSGLAIVIGFIFESRDVSGGDFFSFLTRLLFIAFITYFVYVFVMSYREISRQKKRIEGISDLNKNLLSTVSNQLRTPLPLIRDYLEMLVTGKVGSVSKKQLKFLGQTQRITGDLMDRANSAIFYQQIKRDELYIKKIKVNLCALLKKIVKEEKPAVETSGLRIEFRSRLSKVNASIDEQKISSVIKNIIENSVDYSQGKGKITVKLSQAKASNYALIEIKDQGIGIPANFLPKIFKPNKRAKNAKKIIPGSPGIDLYVAKKIIERHKGSIDIKSVQGKGTTIFITLPTIGKK